MKTNFKLRRAMLGIALLGVASASSSLTLGGVRGTVVVGQPLSISVQLSVDASDDARSLCLAAEVFNGDARVDSSRVTVSMDAPDASGNALVRIRSSAVVDEAFVSVNLRAGCLQTSSRRFVLLSDVVTETVPEPAAQVATAPALPVPAAAAAPAAPVAVAPAEAGQSAAAGLPPTTVRAPASTRPAAALPRPPALRSQAVGVVKPAVPRPVRTVVQPRLKLDTVEPMAAIDRNLRKSTELSTSPAASPEKSAEAAVLWRTLNAQPQDLLKEAQRLQGLEAEFKAFRELTSKNQAELSARLQLADEQRNLGMYFYMVSALLVLALALVAGLWWSLRRRVEAQREWWQDREQVAKADKLLRAAASQSPPGSGQGASGRTADNVDLNLETKAAQGGAAGAPLDSAATMKLQPLPAQAVRGTPSAGKPEHAEELFDIQQQADFFMSLGQTDQAIALLNNHIRSSEETSPLAYLDLLRIYHSTGRTQEYDALRTSFMRVFNASVPEFTAYGGETRDLESYRGLVPSIQAAWGTPKGEKMLEEMVFRRPGSKWDHAFEMSAYTELLLLQAIARELSGTASGERNPVSAFGVLPIGDRADASVGANAPSSLGLDLDLGGPEPVVGNISAYLERPEPDFSAEAPTRPAALGEMGARASPASRPEPSDNMLDFRIDPVLPTPDKNKG